MRFKYAGTDEGLLEAVKFCNQLLSSDTFWNAVANHPPFDATDVLPRKIAALMQAETRLTTILDWTTRRLIYRKTVALTDLNRPFTILYHSRFLGNPVANKVNTIVHEYVHVTDYFGDGSRDIEFGHVGQSSSGNQGTAPYAIGSIAELFYRDAVFRKEGMVATIGSFDLVCDAGVARDDEVMA